MSRHRYPGINSFTENDEAIFCGRSEDAKKLLARLMLGKTLVLHGESGKGKTSLVQAGLLPELKRYNSLLKRNGKLPYLPVIIKMNEVAKNDTGTAILQHVLHTIWDFQVRADMHNDATVPFLTEHKDSLWYQATLAERNGYSLVLIFDQFEELQNFSRTEITGFTLQLSELFMGIMPDRFYKEYDEGTKRINAEERTNTYNEDIKFIEQPLSTRLMFVVREDRLGTMSLMNDHFPDILKNDYFLLPLTERSARLAISEPCKTEGDFESKPFVIEPDAVDELIARLTKKEDPGFFDPIELQIVCSIIERKTSVGKKSITAAQLPEQKDILNSYYHGIWTEVRAKLKMEQWEFEDRQKLLLDKLVVDGRRNLVIGKQLIEDGNKQDQLIVKELLDMGFLRMVFPIDQQTKFYQLTHDRLIQPLTDHQSTLRAREEVKGDIEQNKRRLARVKKIGLWVGGVLLVITTIVILIAYARVRKQKRIAEQEKYLLISNSLRRGGNPTLAYVIARDWWNKHRNSEDMSQYLSTFDSSNYVYLSNIFPTWNSPVWTNISSDNKRLLVQDRSHLVHWDLGQGMIVEQVEKSSTEADRFYSQIETANGKILDVFNRDETYVLKDQSGNELSDFDQMLIYNIEQLAISPTTKLAYVEGRIFDLTGRRHPSIDLPKRYLRYGEDEEEDGQAPKKVKPEMFPSAVVFISDSCLIVGYSSGDIVMYGITGTNQKKVGIVYETEGSSPTFPGFSGSEYPISAMAYDNKRKLLYTANHAYHIDIWDTTLKAVNNDVYARKVLAHGGKINCLSMSSDNKFLLSGSEDNSAILWDMDNLSKYAVLKAPGSSPVRYARFANNDRDILTVTANDNVCLWKRGQVSDLYNKDQLYRFSDFNYSVWMLNMHEDGQTADTLSTKGLFKMVLRQVINMPVSSEYPEDKSYNDTLRLAKDRVMGLYARLMAKSDYTTVVTEPNRVILDSRYYDVLSEVDKRIINTKAWLAEDFEPLLADSANKIEPHDYRAVTSYIETFLERKRQYPEALKYLTFCTDSIVKLYSNRVQLALFKRDIDDAWLRYYLYTGQNEEALKKAAELNMIARNSFKADVYFVVVDLASGKYNQAATLYQSIMADSTRSSMTANTEKVAKRLLRQLKDRKIAAGNIDRFAGRFNIKLE